VLAMYGIYSIFGKGKRLLAVLSNSFQGGRNESSKPQRNYYSEKTGVFGITCTSE
jgi:hypothetical protein